jgi:hypothetical protein
MMNTKIQVYRRFMNIDFDGYWWCFLSDDDRITGRWRIEEDDVVIEVAHSHVEGWLRKKRVEVMAWYGSDAVKFVHEFECAMGAMMDKVIIGNA